jgi:hypothetical protein
MVYTIQNLKTLNLNPGFEFQQLSVSLKHLINLVMWIRDTGCHNGRLVPRGCGRNHMVQREIGCGKERSSQEEDSG